jgi:hypothetical protein
VVREGGSREMINMETKPKGERHTLGVGHTKRAGGPDGIKVGKKERWPVCKNSIFPIAASITYGH